MKVIQIEREEVKLLLFADGCDNIYKTLTSLITWTIALSNSMELRDEPWHVGPPKMDGWVMVESSDKTWSTGEGMANHFSVLALRTT